MTELVFGIEIAGHFDSWHRAATGVSVRGMGLLDTLSRFWPHLASSFHVLAALLASIHALLHKRDSRSATLWLVTIWFLPVLGPILYLALGINRIRRRAISLGTHNNVARPIPTASRVERSCPSYYQDR